MFRIEPSGTQQRCEVEGRGLIRNGVRDEVGGKNNCCFTICL